MQERRVKFHSVNGTLGYTVQDDDFVEAQKLQRLAQAVINGVTPKAPLTPTNPSDRPMPPTPTHAPDVPWEEEPFQDDQLAQAPAQQGGLPPACTKCNGPIWDNREGKKNPKAPDWKCKNKECKDDSGKYVTGGWIKN